MVKLACKRCGKEFTKKYNLLAHLKRVSWCKPIIADLSPLNQLQELNASCDRPTCPKCGKQFSKKQNLDYHVAKVRCAPPPDFIPQPPPVIVPVEPVEPIHPINVFKDSFQETQGTIYIIICREFIRLNEPVYKIGKTRSIEKRAKQYPKGSRVLFSEIVPDMHVCELDVLSSLRENPNVQERREYGSEYFHGDYRVIRDIVASKTRYMYKMYNIHRDLEQRRKEVTEYIQTELAKITALGPIQNEHHPQPSINEILTRRRSI